VRFDDRVTGKLSEFAKHGRIVHVDIDASEINKNKAPSSRSTPTSRRRSAP
jgi:thiamine pyrophosphate-dependent acetolactate synthase large subunit-like protein